MSSSQSGVMLGPRFTVLLLAGVAGMSLLAIGQGVSVGLAAPFGLVALGLLCLRPMLGTVLFLALAYMNAPVLIGRVIGSPQIAAMGVTALVGFPVLVYMFKRRGIVVDYTFLLMLLFLGSLLGSSFVAVDVHVAFAWITVYVVEGVLMYFLVLNAVRSLGMLRAAIWTMVVVSAFLSSLGLYQELTHKYQAQFGGLAQRDLGRGIAEDDDGTGLVRQRSEVLVSNRAAGPVNGPNRFAQILIVVLPLAFFRFRDERKRWVRLLALGCMLLILAGFAITYSRGGILTFVGLVMIMIFLGYIRWWQMLLGGVLLTLVVLVVAPGFLGRLETFRTLPQLLSQRDTVEGHGAIRGRLTEMLAGVHCFFDYPLLGVGPGQYMPFYSVKYMENPEIAFRSLATQRRAHCLYAELSAETGIVGILLFLGIVGTLLARLWSLRRRFRRKQPGLANTATAFWLGIMGYLGSAVFLHLAFQRYLWILLALAGATVQILEKEWKRLAEPVSGAPSARDLLHD